jgi:MFS family permease
VALFLANLEIPIVTTSLVAITNDFHGFESGSWIISGYLLGFVGMFIVAPDTFRVLNTSSNHYHHIEDE